MKRILMAVALTFVAVTMFAQEKEFKKEGRHDGRSEAMKSALALTDDQVNKINAIQERYHGRMLSLRHDSTLTKDKRHEELRTLNAERQTEINSVLTKEQQDKWKSIKEEKRQGKKEFKDARKNFREELGLTSDQEKRISDERKKMRESAEALKKDQSLSKEQKHEKFKSLCAEHETMMKAILTPEQFAKWKERPVNPDGKHRRSEGKHRSR